MINEYIYQEYVNGDMECGNFEIGGKVTSTQIIRCGSCRHRRAAKGCTTICILTGAKIKFEDFCSHGARMKED